MAITTRVSKTPAYTIRSVQDDAGNLTTTIVPQDGERNITVIKVEGTQVSTVTWHVTSDEASAITSEMLADLPATYLDRVAATAKQMRREARQARLAQIEVEKASLATRQTEITDEELRIANEIVTDG